MMSHCLLIAAASAKTRFELGRDLSTPADWILPICVLLLLSWFVIGMYLRDCVELGGRFATVLISLRLLALVGLLAVYLQPQWRATREVVDNSRALVLVDTSQSMGRRDVQMDDDSSSVQMLPRSEGAKTADLSDPDQQREPGQAISRIDRVVAELQQGTLLSDLRKVHDVVVYRFDAEDKPTPLATLPKLPSAHSGAADVARQLQQAVTVRTARQRLGGAGVALLLALIAAGWYLLKPSNRGRLSRSLLVGAGVAAVIAVGITIWAFASAPDVGIRELLAPDDPASGPQGATLDRDTDDQQEAIDWSLVLNAQGADTQLGQAIYQLVVDQRATPVAGIVVLSDGQRTAGLQIDVAAKVAKESGIPLYTIGLGTIEKPEFVRLADYAAPARAYQNDPFKITAYLQSQGLAGRSATVTLRQMSAADGTQQDADDVGIVYETETTLGADSDDIVPVVFDVEGVASAGRYAFELEVMVKGASRSDIDTNRRFYIDVVAHRTRVLLLAGGPSREYQFLRNLLRRDDRQIEVDVLLQSKDSAANDPGFLATFPSSDELLEYDVVIAIDPDWDDIGASQAALIESWVGDEAGGLIVIPGVVYAGSIIQSWIQDQDYENLRDLYPVIFRDQQDDFEDRGHLRACAVQFTRDGIDADFLQLDDNPLESQRIWERFEGIFGGYQVKESKFGATVYAHYADEMAESLGYKPVLFAGQFYGKGRVFYLASAEMWRIRKLDEAYFEQFYTRLIRHVSMGRLHRGSSRGDVMLLEKEVYNVGDTVRIVAQLMNAQRDPYDADSFTMFVIDAKGKATSIKLKADPVRPGTFRGDFIARQTQDYRLELQPPESDDQMLSKVIKVSTSDREKRNPQQDDQALKRLAIGAGGRYFASIEAALGRAGDAPLAPSLEDQSRATPVDGDVDPIWAAAWSKWMMFCLCGVLCFEWLLRRLFKLA